MDVENGKMLTERSREASSNRGKRTLLFGLVGFVFTAACALLHLHADQTVSLGLAVGTPLNAIPPITSVHHGSVVFLAGFENTTTIEYKRVFKVPCDHGILVFNIGPAASTEPFEYEIYADAYAFTNQKGLCPLFPTYTATQVSHQIMWAPTDPTEVRIDHLGDELHKISTRILRPPKTKPIDAELGGDFCIIRKGNFYDAGYYKAVKRYVNSLKAGDDIATLLRENTLTSALLL
jgi:hypothetical protein